MKGKSIPRVDVFRELGHFFRGDGEKYRVTDGFPVQISVLVFKICCFGVKKHPHSPFAREAKNTDCFRENTLMPHADFWVYGDMVDSFPPFWALPLC